MDSKSTILMDVGQGLSLMLGLPRIASWKTSERPNKPKNGTFGFNLETNSLEYYNESHWYSAKMSQG